MDIDKIQTDIHSSFQYILRFKKKRQCIMKTGLRTFYDSFYLQKCSIFISGYFVLSLMTRTRVNVYVQGEYVTQTNIDKNVFFFSFAGYVFSSSMIATFITCMDHQKIISLLILHLSFKNLIN